MHLAFTWSSVVYFAVCIISRNGGAAVTYDVQLDCPPEFVDATPSLVNATVSTTKFPLCTDDQVTKVIFTVTPTVGVSQRICEQPYPGCNTTTNSNGCRCVNNTGSTYIYELSFVFDKQTQTGSTLDLKPTPCFSFSNPYPFLHSPCRNLTGKATTPTTAATTSKDSTPPTLPLPRCTCCRCPVLILLVLLLPFPGPWPGYLIYVLICWIIYKRHRSTGSGCWHTHYLCGKKTCCVYFSACIVTNNGGAVLIWSKSPATGRFVCYGTEKTLDTSRNNVSAEIGAVDNGNKHSSQKEKNKHTGTDGSPRKSRQPEASVELTPVRTSSPPQAATVHGDNQASGTPHGDHQASATPRLRPLPEPSRMTSVERNSTAETSNMLGRDKHHKLPPIGKHDNNS